MLKKYSALFSMCLVLSLLFSSLLYAGSTLDKVLSRSTLKVGVDVGYIPFEMVDFDGGLTGFDIELAQMLGSEMGVKVEFVKTPFESIINELNADKFDIIISGMSVTTKRSLTVNFSEPYAKIGQSILVNKQFQGGYNKCEDLDKAGFEIYVQSGTTGHDLALRTFKNAKVVPVKYIFECANAVKSKSNAVFLYDSPFVKAYSDKYRTTAPMGKSPLTQEDLAVAIRKGDPDFLNVVNSFIRQIKGDGRLAKLEAKYLSFKSAPEESAASSQATTTSGKTAKPAPKQDSLDRYERLERMMDSAAGRVKMPK